MPPLFLLVVKKAFQKVETKPLLVRIRWYKIITHRIMEDKQMSESIKDKFLKEHALNDDDLEKVSGGVAGKDENVVEYDYSCQNPRCVGNTMKFDADSEGKHCPYCSNGLIIKVQR